MKIQQGYILNQFSNIWNDARAGNMTFARYFQRKNNMLIASAECASAIFKVVEK